MRSVYMKLYSDFFLSPFTMRNANIKIMEYQMAYIFFHYGYCHVWRCGHPLADTDCGHTTRAYHSAKHVRLSFERREEETNILKIDIQKRKSKLYPIYL